MRKVTGGGLVALLAGGGIVTLTQPSLAADGTLDAADVSVSSTDGQLDSLTITPSITVDWANQDAAVATVEVTWHTSGPNTSKSTVGNTPYAFTPSSSSTDGSLTRDMGEINLLNTLDASAFSADTDGNTTTSSVELWLDVTLKDSGDNILDQQDDILNTTFQVSVTNTEASASLSASGTANTSGS
ncbi:hypothetical protein GCM10027435_02890 [Haloparvum alkalitolerans]